MVQQLDLVCDPQTKRHPEGKMTMNDWTKLCVYSTLAAGCTVAAHRSATRLGLPAAAVRIIGVILLSVLSRMTRQ